MSSNFFFDIFYILFEFNYTKLIHNIDKRPTNPKANYFKTVFEKNREDLNVIEMNLKTNNINKKHLQNLFCNVCDWLYKLTKCIDNSLCVEATLRLFIAK